MITAEQIKQLSTAEKLQVMETLWQELTAEGADQLPSPAWHQQAGVWRFGVNYDSTGLDFPFRWAIGRPEDLEQRMIDGKPQFYLLPGARGEVSGCIEFDAAPPAGTQFWWGGLIHEFVAISNNDVDRIQVDVGAP